MARDDYTKAQRDSWQRARLRDDIAKRRVSPTENINRFLAGSRRSNPSRVTHLPT